MQDFTRRESLLISGTPSGDCKLGDGEVVDSLGCRSGLRRNGELRER